MWTLAALALAAILGFAWIDGGRRPPEWIEAPVPLPEDAR